ncbi:hypothetical protein VB735_26820 [Halotia wernerae UHCC 0503]|nr:hypothetical protein [Halotia wernerae UHCC 0503]
MIDKTNSNTKADIGVKGSIHFWKKYLAIGNRAPVATLRVLRMSTSRALPAQRAQRTGLATQT